MQYGSLSGNQIAEFVDNQANRIRRPSFVLWIEGFGDPTDYVMEIDSEVSIERPRGRGKANIGRAMLTMSNEDGYFYGNGKSNVPKNARMKVWAGFNRLNIPIFTGFISHVEPAGTTDVVYMECKDYMGFFQEIMIKGSQDPNNTPKLLIENFCDQIAVSSAVPETDETTAIYDNPTFEEVTLLQALEEVCGTIFYIAYFDENGTLRTIEREYSNTIDLSFTDNNVTECEKLADSEVVNSITIEYMENFLGGCQDQVSIDTYGMSSRTDRRLLLNSTLIAERTTGATTEELSHNLEGFKFTSAVDAATIDCIHIKMKKDGAHGYVTAKIYSNSGGLPDSIMAISQLKASDDLSRAFAWEIFYFPVPLEIKPSTDYWVIIDTGSVSSGAVYVQISNATATAKHAYYNGGWVTENDKQVLHKIRGSLEAQRVAEDIIRFYKDPSERIKIVAPAAPQLQLFDEVLVDISLRNIRGRYVIEGRRHIITPDSYTTIDTLRKAG